MSNDLKNIASAATEIKLSFSEVRFLGRGTAIEIDSPELISLRTKLANKWQERLTPQDGQKFKPHITVQNKVEPEAAKTFYEKLKAEWQIRKGNVVGLQLWHYLDGPWQLASEFLFKTDGK